jgi:lipopolysaccharide/colanic/teichoic acid biosynthesis glycosyltransferase
MRRRIECVLKRAIDVLASAALLAILAPIFLIIAVAICIESPGGPIFVQKRVGYGGTKFQMLKFRTMIRDAEQIGSGLYVSESDRRVTRLGRILRRFSLDELPQLVHVLTGKMSLVGPRPGLPYQLALYTPRQRRRLSVRPGLTGWSQINGRNELSWPQRLEHDLWYIDHFCLWLDVRILFRTAAVWLSGQGLYAPRDRFFFSQQDDLPLPSRRES